MSLILVRHGETAGNFARVVQGPEIPLNETGLQQAERVAARLRDEGAVRVLTSDHPRALMTAEAIARHTGLPLLQHAILRERDMGDFRGRAYSTFTEFHPLAPDVNPPNGETWDAFHLRVREAFAWLVAERARVAAPLIVVTHGLVLRSVFERVLDRAPLVATVGFANTGVSILEAAPPHAHSLLNCVRHLDTNAERGEI
ncbi:MAG: histidine phosphatase family protein [Polyangiales bacterium]